jgi:hypothetical protein
MGMRPGQIVNMFNNVGAYRAQMNIADSEYAVPNQAYLVNEFCPFYREELVRMGLGKWEPQWDCDDFAWQFYTQIRWAHYRSKESMSEGIAVGVVYYMAGARAEDGTGGGHAINFAVVGDRDNRELIFIEPQFAGLQNGPTPILPLNEHELRSIWFVNM